MVSSGATARSVMVSDLGALNGPMRRASWPWDRSNRGCRSSGRRRCSSLGTLSALQPSCLEPPLPPPPPFPLRRHRTCRRPLRHRRRRGRGSGCRRNHSRPRALPLIGIGEASCVWMSRVGISLHALNRERFQRYSATERSRSGPASGVPGRAATRQSHAQRASSRGGPASGRVIGTTDVAVETASGARSPSSPRLAPARSGARQIVGGQDVDRQRRRGGAVAAAIVDAVGLQCGEVERERAGIGRRREREP